MNDLVSWLKPLIDTSKLGGWVRAGVASGLATLITQDPTLAQYLSPTTQNALAVAAAGIVVGLWSHVAKASNGS